MGWSGFPSLSHHGGSFLPRFAFRAGLFFFFFHMDNLQVKEKGDREGVGVEQKGDILISVPANESMTTKNEPRFIE